MRKNKKVLSSPIKVISGLKKTNIIEIILLAVVLFFAAIIFMYGDIINTIDNANILLRATYHGHLLDFYEWSVEQSVTSYAANYNFAMYILFAIWQAPAYLVAHVLDKVYLEWAWALLWSKLLVVLFSIAVAFLIYKIVLFITENKKRSLLAVLLYYGSMLTFYPVFICGQLDVISMTFVLAGVYWYLKGSMKKFWLFFLIAVPFKMFALILALPLVLVKQKNLLKAAAIWASMASLIVVEKIIFHGSAIYKYALGSQSRDAINNLLAANIVLGKPITVFLVCYLALLVYVWVKEITDKRTVIYIGFFVWGTFITLSAINTYWVFLAVPFMVMSICINDRFIKFTPILETTASIGYFLYVALHSYIFQYNGLVSHLFLPKMISIPGDGRGQWMDSIPKDGQSQYANLHNLFTVMQWDRYSALFSTLFIFSIIAILVLTAPKLQQSNSEDVREPETWIMLLRPILLGIASALIIYAYTASTNLVAHDTRQIENYASEADLVSADKDDVVTQKVTFEDDRNLDELIVKFDNTQYSRQNMALLHVEVWDTDANKRIFDDVIGCSFIEDDTDLRIDLDDVSVQSGTNYEIRLYGKAGNAVLHSSSHLYPYFTEETDLELEPVTVNGEKQDNYLYFQIR